MTGEASVGGFGRGKVILLGEHSVVHGRPALAAALRRGANATAVPSETPWLVAPDWDLCLRADAEADEPLARAYAALLGHFPGASYEVTLDVALPAGAGLGCSAAIGVAIADALDNATGSGRDAAGRAEITLDWERVFHGNPSGLDNTMAAMGGVAMYRKGEAPEPVHFEAPLHLVVARSGDAPSTKDMVSMVRRQFERDPERIGEVFDAIAALVQNARLSVMAGDHVALGQLFDLNHGLLSGLLLSTTELEEMCRVAREAGALGAKLTGGGGGGCMIALARDAEHAAEVLDALRPLAVGPAFTTEVSP